MKQVLQSLKTGQIDLAEIPCPEVKHGHVLVRSRLSLLSAGTERMLLNFGKANLLDKARQQPDKVRMVIEKARTDGLAATLESVRAKLDQPFPLGYCNVGVVEEVGAGVDGLRPGDRVVSNGRHAELVHVPKNLCARIPDAVSDEEAVFSVLGAIALQGVRLAQPALGEIFVVGGLGLIGLLAVQLLRLNGCRVLALDFDPGRLALAGQFGAEPLDLSSADPLGAARTFSGERGVDGVLIAASSKSSEPVHQAAEMCRQRGRIVLIGDTGLELSRADFYKKELSFQVSCSYGPGRYDPAYEESGHDYPYGFVRWTAHRNFEAILELLADRRLDVTPLITRQFPLSEAEAAYELVQAGGPALGILLRYSDTPRQNGTALRAKTVPTGVQPTVRISAPRVGFVGAGNYAVRTLMPAFQAAGANLSTVASAGGLSAAHAAKKFGFENASTDVEALIENPSIDAVVIATRHDTHAGLVCRALASGKHVFVEKPLALTTEQLERIEAAYAGARLRRSPVLMAGFNRRFAPHVQKIKALLHAMKEPKSFIMTVNAGALPAEHWTQQADVGGGRIVGEACHFIDLLLFLAGARIASVRVASMIRPHVDGPRDTVSFSLGFADGSMGTVHYLANGNKSFPKERLEIFCGGRILQLDNFRKLRGYGWPRFSKLNLWNQDKGNRAAVSAFVTAVHNGQSSPIQYEDLIQVSRVALEVSEAASLCGSPTISIAPDS